MRRVPSRWSFFLILDDLGHLKGSQRARALLFSHCPARSAFGREVGLGSGRARRALWTARGPIPSVLLPNPIPQRGRNAPEAATASRRRAERSGKGLRAMAAARAFGNVAVENSAVFHGVMDFHSGAISAVSLFFITNSLLRITRGVVLTPTCRVP